MFIIIISITRDIIVVIMIMIMIILITIFVCGWLVRRPVLARLRLRARSVSLLVQANGLFMKPSQIASIGSRVAPRLTENRVPVGGYPEPSVSSRLGYTLIYTYAAAAVPL